MTFDLASAIKAAQPVPAQPVVTIPAGDYPAVTLRGLNPAIPVRIVGQGVVTFTGLDIFGCTGLNFEGITVHDPAPATASGPIVLIQDCSSVTLKGCKVSGSAVGGLLQGKGISVVRSSVIIDGCEVFDCFKGVSLDDGAGSIIRGCELHNIRTSPINGGGDLSNVQITSNHIHDLVPVAAQVDHSDGIHFWTKNNTKPIDGLLIQGNQMELANAGGTLGINLEGTPAPGGFTNCTVADNALKWNNNQGITTNWVQGQITGNSLLPAPGLDNPAHAPGIVLRNSTVTITGNTVKMGPSMKPFPNNTFLTAAQIAAYLAGSA